MHYEMDNPLTPHMDQHTNTPVQTIQCSALELTMEISLLQFLSYGNNNHLLIIAK